MKVAVDRCWGGGNSYTIRLTVLVGWKRFHIRAEEWSRAVASKALDLLEAEGYTRRNVRFYHN